jgi:pimeloyl-ACP methyl ester carboxylesterase
MLTLWLAGCSLAVVQQHRIEHAYARAGLVPHTATIGQETMHWWSGGHGPPLLLVHGFGGDGMFCWVGQLPLARDHTLIVPDLVWFGKSTSTSTDYGLDLQLRGIQAVLDAEHVDKASVVGVSYGGFVVAALDSLHPERVDKLVIVDSPGREFSSADEDALLARFHATSPEDLFVPTGPDGVRVLIDLAYVHPPPTPGFLMSDVYRHLFVDATDEKRQLLRALAADREQLTAEWNISAPTLVIWGAEDPVFPVALGQKLAAGIDGARFVVLPGTAHAPNLEDASGFDAAVEAFLAP